MIPRLIVAVRRSRVCLRAEGGQSTVELVALLPFLVALAFAGFTILAAHSAADQAAAAAQAGAMAMLQDGDPRDAARSALPEGARSRAAIAVRGRSVRVTVRPAGPVPSLTRSLTATSEADAGPEPSP